MPSDFDTTRFIEALTRHQPALEAFCYANIARREDAQEVLQATCVKLWQKASDWDQETAFLPWAFTVARYVALSHLRDLTSMVFAYALPRAVATVAQLSALADGSFEKQSGPLPSGFPAEFGVWSGEATEIVEKGSAAAFEGDRMLRFIRSEDKPALKGACAFISSWICAR